MVEFPVRYGCVVLADELAEGSSKRVRRVGETDDIAGAVPAAVYLQCAEAQVTVNMTVGKDEPRSQRREVAEAVSHVLILTYREPGCGGLSANHLSDIEIDSERPAGRGHEV